VRIQGMALILIIGAAAGSAADDTPAALKKQGGDPTAASPFNIGDSQLVFSASQEQKTAKARVVFTLERFKADLSVSAPIDESGAKQKTLATRDALADQTSLEIGLTHFIYETTPVDDTQNRLCADYRRSLSLSQLTRADKYEAPGFTARQTLKWKALLTTLKKRAKDSPIAAVYDRLDETAKRAVDASGESPNADQEAAIRAGLEKLLKEKDLAAKVKVPESGRREALVTALKTTPNGDKALALRNRLLLEAALPGAIPPYPDDDGAKFRCDTSVPELAREEFWRPAKSPILMFGRLKAGQKSYKYFDSAFAPLTTDHTGIAASTGVGTIVPANSGAWFFGVSYKYERSYKAGSARQICSPLGTNGSQECSSLPVGAPAGSSAEVLQLEVRKFIGLRLALSPKLSYERREAVKAAELAVYFVPEKDGRLTGGVSAGWDTKDRKATATLFVGLPVNLGF
jgi:hypothetical protein